MKAAYKDADGRWWRSLGPATDELRNSSEVQQWHGAAREMWGEVFVPHASPAKRFAKKERDMAKNAASKAERAVLVTTASARCTAKFSAR